jgi:putative membrane protein
MILARLSDFHWLDFLLFSIVMNETHDSPADPRIYMAAERTFLAWIRTGIAFMGFGFVVARFGLFLREIAISNNMTVAQHGNGFSLPVGIALIVAGVMTILIAAIRHHRYIKALDRGQFRQAYGLIFTFLIAGFLAIIGLAVAIYLAVLL